MDISSQTEGRDWIEAIHEKTKREVESTTAGLRSKITKVQNNAKGQVSKYKEEKEKSEKSEKWMQADAGILEIYTGGGWEG